MSENQKYISVKGARVNNLKNIDLKIPKEKLVVMTGLSGSGKTSLAFDTIYAEGQRRYVESLSAYARQFLGGIDKPDVDAIEGLSPAIAIDQKTTSNNPRSTVGTITEIYDYLRLLYARIGHAYCPVHHKEISFQTAAEMTEKVLSYPEGSKTLILAPVVMAEKGRHEKTREFIARAGYERTEVDGRFYSELGEIPELDKNRKHSINVVIDRLKVRPEVRETLNQSIEAALELSGGRVIFVIEGERLFMSEHLACPDCDFSLPKLQPAFFSANSPLGACPECKGIGYTKQVDLAILIPDPAVPVDQGAIIFYKNLIASQNIDWQNLVGLAKYYEIDLGKTWGELTEREQALILYGSPEAIDYEIVTQTMTMQRHKVVEGVVPLIMRRYRETTSNSAREYYNKFLNDITCPACGGKKLAPAPLSVLVGGVNIIDLTAKTVSALIEFFARLALVPTEAEIAKLVIKEIKARLGFLAEVGIGYLTLARSAGSLSGGEAQRIRLATQIGSQLSGVLYVLDEPSIGLHPADSMRLMESLKRMRDLGNSLIIVEHDEEIMWESDYLIDIGPLSGDYGGEVVATGTPAEVAQNKHSITGDYLSGRKQIPWRTSYRQPEQAAVTVTGCRHNNLKNIDVTIKRGAVTVFTGISGSGKSSLVTETIAPLLGHTKTKPGAYSTFTSHYDARDFRLAVIDQKPIGRTPRSNPATYTGVFTEIRNLFAALPEAQARGYAIGRFSFNVKGGRCERCQGDGVIKIPMHFLPDVYIKCKDCDGKRYNEATLQIKYKGKNIYDVLNMRVAEASKFFAAIPKISRYLDKLMRVGLGYIKLGQPSTSLSGGEAQRIKLARELDTDCIDYTFYILDEPTTGLHSDDVARLLKVIHSLADEGGTVVIIEHNLDVIKQADYIFDLGPEGGDAGGYLVAQGTPDELRQNRASYTGRFLQQRWEREHEHKPA